MARSPQGSEGGERQGQQVVRKLGARSTLEGGKEEVRCKVNSVQEEVRGKVNRFQGEGMRGKVSRLYISEAQGHQVCGAR